MTLRTEHLESAKRIQTSHDVAKNRALVGIVVGTYSSIYVAGSLAVAIGLDRSKLMPVTRKLEDALP